MQAVCTAAFRCYAQDWQMQAGWQQTGYRIRMLHLTKKGTAHTCDNLLEVPNYWEALLKVKGIKGGGADLLKAEQLALRAGEESTQHAGWSVRSKSAVLQGAVVVEKQWLAVFVVQCPSQQCWLAF
eukprot:scaffold44988_cov14-Tisochrysis_lutea.AAC.1